jgi:hypothetical protein
MSRQGSSLFFRANGSPRAAFWGPVAFLTLAVIGLVAA